MVRFRQRLLFLAQYLQAFPFDKIKIDRAFCHESRAETRNRAAIVRARHRPRPRPRKCRCREGRRRPRNSSDPVRKRARRLRAGLFHRQARCRSGHTPLWWQQRNQAAWSPRASLGRCCNGLRFVTVRLRMADYELRSSAAGLNRPSESRAMAAGRGPARDPAGAGRSRRRRLSASRTVIHGDLARLERATNSSVSTPSWPRATTGSGIAPIWCARCLRNPRPFQTSVSPGSCGRGCCV